MLRVLSCAVLLLVAAPAWAQVGPVPPGTGEPEAANAPPAPTASTAVSAPTAATTTTTNAMASRSTEAFDFQLEGGAGLALQGDLDDDLFARARIGGLLVREPLILALGVIGEVGGLSELGIGAQLDFIHLWSGFSLELGAVYARGGGAVVHASVGWQIFGVEWQHHTRDDVAASDAVFGKIRLPIGVILALM